MRQYNFLCASGPNPVCRDKISLFELSYEAENYGFDSIEFEAVADLAVDASITIAGCVITRLADLKTVAEELCKTENSELPTKVLGHILAEQKIGQLHPKGTLFMTVAIGKASSEDDSFEMSTSMSGSPMVQHQGTGNWFLLSWQDILALAVARGIKEAP